MRLVELLVRPIIQLSSHGVDHQWFPLNNLLITFSSEETEKFPLFTKISVVE